MERPRTAARKRKRGAGRSRIRPIILSAALAAAALTATEVVSPTSDAAAAGLTAFHGWPGSNFFNNFFHGGFGNWFNPRPPTTRPTTPTAPPTMTSGATPTTTPAGGGTGGGGLPATPNLNCTLTVPRNPLSAAGLATPYRLKATDAAQGPCNEANADQSAFVEAAIYDPGTNAISLYHPLVIDDGTQPAIAPVTPTLPRGAVVAVWFGYQANVLTLNGHTRDNRGHRYFHRKGNMRVNFGNAQGCVNGTAGSPFGQFAYCNAPRFFQAAARVAVPPLATGNDGLPCPTTRDFGIVDQDQSDNLPGKYLATANGQIAQFSASNQNALPGATVLTNASDNGLVDNKWGPAVGCTPWKVADLSQNGDLSAGLALNELQAAASQGPPMALVPVNDPMTLDNNGKTSILKTNLYRAGVNMPPVSGNNGDGKTYCMNMGEQGAKRIGIDTPQLTAAGSPDAAFTNLLGFVTDRLTASWTNLNCPALTGMANPPAIGTTTTATTAPTATTVPPTTTTTAPTSVPAADPNAAGTNITPGNNTTPDNNNTVTTDTANPTTTTTTP